MKTIAIIAKVILIAIVTVLVLRLVASAQQPPSPDLPIDAATKSAVIENLIIELNEGYIFAETAKKIEENVRARAGNKEYDLITSSLAFAEKLTTDLQAISHDKHLRIRFSFRSTPVRTDKHEPTPEEKAEFERFVKRRNYGFDRAERMDGNIGYIELRGFFDPDGGAATVAAAFSMVANTDALIIDLRQNGGGDPAMVARVCSYLFGDKRVHLNDLYSRRTNKTEEFWTDPTVPGKKFLDKDVYVLTSARTFSGAEEFANNLKVLKRATMVGETTGGGANPGEMIRLSEHIGVFVPTGRAINPITKTNWEGTGVEPDIKAPKDQALKIAYIMALKKSFATEKDENLKRQLQEVIDQTQKELDEIKAKK